MFCVKFWPFRFQHQHRKSYTPPVPKVPLVSKPETPSLSTQDVLPTKRALLIGISDYPHLPPHQQLPGCSNDVTLLNDLLSKRFGFAKRNISCLRDKQATRDGIFKAFQNLIASVKKDDVVVIHYSGHGSYIRDKTKGAGWTETIVPYDSGRKPSNRPSTDIKDIEISERLLEPLVRKTPFVTLLFDSCHSGSILRDGFGMAVRGIDPDGEVRINRDIESAMISGWVPQIPAFRDLTPERYTLLAACRANEKAAEISINGTPYGAFTYHLCNIINESHSEEMRALFQSASTKVTAHYPNQHPILEGSQNALIFGATRLDSPRYLGIRSIDHAGETKVVEMDGGLVSGVTQGSIWAIRPVGAPPRDSDALITVKEVLPFVSRAEVTRPGDIKAEFGCFEISHVYGEAALNIFLDDKDPRFEGFLSHVRDPNASGALNIVREISTSDVRLVFLEKRNTVAEGDMVPQLGPLEDEACVALSPDGRLLLPPTTDLTDLCENLRKLARYRFGLGLRNLDEDNELREKVTLELKWRQGGSTRNDPWRPARMGEDGFPFFQTSDQIACVIRNKSNVKVWPYVLEFAEDGSVTQRYPGTGGEEGLAAGSSTREVAKMKLGVSTENAFQLAEYGALNLKAKEGNCRGRVTEVLKLFASTERIDLSLLLQTSFVLREDSCGLSSLLRKGDMLDEDDVLAWETVNAPFVLEFDM